MSCLRNVIALSRVGANLPVPCNLTENCHEDVMATILVVEDDVRIQKDLHRLFATEGYEVKCAPDGNTGLEFFQAGNVDAVVLDLMLPGISGRELCKTIKHAAPDKPVII